MRRFETIIGSLIAMMIAALLLVSPAQAQTRSWQLSEVSGSVSVETAGKSVAAARGMALKAGDAVTTGATGRAVIVRGGEYAIVSPKSRIRITKPQEDGAITQIFQSIGSVLFKIKKKETPHFGVSTPYLAAVVKGTTFNVTVTPNGATVQVTEGRVEVGTKDGGAKDMIVPGRIGRVDARDPQLLKVVGDDEKSIRSPLPSAPVVTEPAAAAQNNDDAAKTKAADDSDDGDTTTITGTIEGGTSGGFSK
ncbi:MAG: FecR domain-containing protein [Sphingopyxis sp.]|nr:FecR domain-containing protein [Sphingopyxis sp.]